MAVPKSKVSPSRKGMRNANRKNRNVKVVLNNIGADRTTGEANFSHRMSMSDGYYRGEQVYVAPVKSEKNEEEASK